MSRFACEGRAHPAWLVLGLGFLFAATPAAQAAREFEKVGTIGAQFLKLPFDARGTAMGAAFTAIADDASAVFWNPAGLARLSGPTFAIHHTPWLADIQLSQATYVSRVRFVPGVFAVHGRALYLPEDKVRTVFRPEGDGTTFDAGDLALGLSYARSLTDKFSTGIGVNWIRSTLAAYTAQAVTFDFGTLYDTGFRSFRIGMAIQNIGSDMTFIEDPVKVPTIFRVGMSSILFDRAGQRILVSGEFAHPPDNSERANVGMEYSMRDLLFLRGGWFYRFDLERFSAGAGVRIPSALVPESRFDYSYTDLHDLPGVHRLSAEFRF
jgi:hypothetical protein